jgi:hypothetical protein
VDYANQCAALTDLLKMTSYLHKVEKKMLTMAISLVAKRCNFSLQLEVNCALDHLSISSSNRGRFLN